jgi:hypothetical protein
MKESCKYIIVQNNGLEMAIVFNAILSHVQVAGNMKVVAAGECYLPDELNPNLVSVWGGSVTLGIDSRQEDAAVIKYSLGIPR